MAPLCLMREDAPQRDYALRNVFNTLCYLPGDLPPWATVYQQLARWRDTRVLESIVQDLNALERVLLGRVATPSVVVLEGRTLQSTPEIRWATC